MTAPRPGAGSAARAFAANASAAPSGLAPDSSWVTSQGEASLTSDPPAETPDETT